MAISPPLALITANMNQLSLPDISIRLNDMVNDPNCSIADIGSLIFQDAALSARLLKIVNSAFYGFPSKIDTISMAITVIGTRQLRDLVLATSVIGKFQQFPEGLISIDTYWYHNLISATATRLIADKLHIRNSERFFIAGLLHDIGKLVMYLTEPEISRQVLKRMNEPHDDVTQLEIDAFGFDHATLGGELLRQWKLPDSLVEPVTYHHHPADAQYYPQETAAVSLANAIANTIEPPYSTDDDLPIDTSIWKTLGIKDSDLDDLICETRLAFSNTVSILYPKQAI
ncbi:Predicted signal transduction protein [hydrothermal vent metagenome]|uniref:Predicted signal transduction protein n=1 Tax=hydrothermal vent metagenome TaxID=652676 RepID=A0A3B1ATD6_9ZZZZ